MEISINKNILKEVEYIRDNIVEYFKDKVTDVCALLVVLQAIEDKIDEIKGQLNE